MSIFYMSLRVLWVGLIVAGAFRWAWAMDHRVTLGDTASIRIRRYCIVTIVTLSLIPLFVESSALFGKDDLVKFNRDTGEVVAVLDEGLMFCTNNCAHLPEHQFEWMAVQPITQNPKVRHIEYTMDVTVCNLKDYFNSIGNTDFGWTVLYQGDQTMAIRAAVEYELYEFNNARSIELAEFYNPRDDEQTAQLERLIVSNVHERLREKGLCVTLDSWKVQ